MIRLPAAAKRALLRLWRVLTRWEPMERFLFRLVNRRYLVGVLGIVRDERGRVLLLDHSPYRRTCPWGLPGGWHDPAETLGETLVREMVEEVGLRVRVDSLFRVISRFDYPRLEIVFTATITGGEMRFGAEIAGHRFVGPDDDYSMILPRHRDVLDSYFRDDNPPFESAAS